MICSKVTEVVEDSKGFCKMMGFKVKSELEQEANGKSCFDGTPATIKSGSLRRPKSNFETGDGGIMSTIDYYVDYLVRKLQNSPHLKKIQTVAGYLIVFLFSYLCYILISMVLCKK